MTDELLISLLAYIINSALLSSFIIPQTQKLKEIKDALVKHQITFVPDSGPTPTEQFDLHKKQEEDVRKLQDQLDMYALRSKELKALVFWFWVALGVAILAIVAVSLFPEQKNILLVMHAILQIGILFIGIRVYAVSPDKMKDIAYLVNELDINPHTLVNALGLNLSLDAKGGLLTKNRKREDPLILSLFPRIRVWGFRYLLVVNNKEGEVFFVSFGPIVSNTAMIRHLAYPSWLGAKEYNRVEVGHCPFDLIEKEQELKISLLIFLPFYRHEASAPYLMVGRYQIYGKESASLTLGSTLGMSSLSAANTYEDIECRGVGDDIRLTVRDGAKDNVLNKVIRKYLRDIETAPKIQEYQDLNGRL